MVDEDFSWNGRPEARMRMRCPARVSALRQRHNSGGEERDKVAGPQRARLLEILMRVARARCGCAQMDIGVFQCFFPINIPTTVGRSIRWMPRLWAARPAPRSSAI